MGSAAMITHRTEARIQHGFAAGSIFAIVASGYLYLLPSASPIFLAWSPSLSTAAPALPTSHAPAR